MQRIRNWRRASNSGCGFSSGVSCGGDGTGRHLRRMINVAGTGAFATARRQRRDDTGAGQENQEGFYPGTHREHYNTSFLRCYSFSAARPCHVGAPIVSPDFHGKSNFCGGARPLYRSNRFHTPWGRNDAHST